MDILNRKLGRRQFISGSSMVLGAGMLAKPSSRLLFAAEGAPPGGGPMDQSPPKTDGTGKYGKYIMLSEKTEYGERGAMMVGINKNTLSESNMTAITGRMPPPGPMPSHDAGGETHENPEFLIHLGNNPDDPLDLGAEVDLYLGYGKWLEKYTFNRSTAVYLPTNFYHTPWKVKKIWREMTWVNVQTGVTGAGFGGAPGAAPGDAPGAAPGSAPATMPQMQALSEEEKAKAKTTGYVFADYMRSGVGPGFTNPKGGEWIAYLDCTIVAEAPLTRIIRYNPEEAPYTVIDTQTHKYESFLILYGIDLDDFTDLGADVEIYMGPEKEKHTFSTSAIVYVPARTVHGPLIVKKARKPFNFLEIVGGPELPGVIL